MVNTTEVVYTARKSFITIYMVIFSFTMVAHIAIISTIFNRNKLSSKRYLIVANISASDCCYCLFALIMLVRSIVDGYVIRDVTYHVLMGFIITSFRVSLLCTCLLTFDRYIAVSQALRYNQIVTTTRIFKCVSSFWVLSLLIVLASHFEKPRHILTLTYSIGSVTLNVIHILVSSIFILSVAGYAITIRKKHITDIKSLRSRFGAEAEKLNLLQSLKRSIHDVMKLNIFTVIVILLIAISSFLLLSVEVVSFLRMRNLAFLIYVVSNPVIYISAIRELRSEMKCFLCGTGRVSNDDRRDPQIAVTAV